MTTKPFPLRVVLTASTGRLLTTPSEGGNGIGDLYALAEWMSGEQVWTHQLVLLAKPMADTLLKRYPELACVNSKLDTLDVVVRAKGSIDNWLHNVQQACGLKDTYEVPRLGAEMHGVIGDPVEDLAKLGVTEDRIVRLDMPSR